MRHLAIALLTLAGCIDEYSGSNVELDFAPNTKVQASAFRAATAEELPNNIHFTLYAFSETYDSSGTLIGHLFEVTKFEIHHIVDLDSPCYIDRGTHVPFPGLHVSQYADQMMAKYGITDYMNPPAGTSQEALIDVGTAVQRQINVTKLGGVEGIQVVSSASDKGYPGVATTCDDTSGIPPPMCTDSGANQRRLDACEGAWGSDKAYFEGTDRVLTQPLNGITNGFVEGSNPVNMAPVGGAAFFVDTELADFDGFAVYWQFDDANHDGMPDYPSTVPQSERTPLGKLILFGRPEHPTRGVIHVHMINLEDPLAGAELAIFANIDQDDVHF